MALATLRSYSDIERAVTSKGYLWSKDKVNYVWERTSDKYTDVFDDFFYVCLDNNVLAIKSTTKPGLLSAQMPRKAEGVEGTAVIIPGQYVNSWELFDGDKLKFFASKFNKVYPFNYTHFRQVAPLRYWRDFNKDAVIDRVQEQKGVFYTHWHAMSNPNTYGSGLVRNWSEGCMGWPEPEARKFLDTTRQQCAKHGDLVTGTLLETKDFI